MELSKINQSDLILEIGTGNGNFTKILQQHCGYLISVEIDRNLYEDAKGMLKYNNLLFLNCDILFKKQLNPLVLEAIGSKKELIPKIVSNPPYSIMSPLLEAIVSSPITFKDIFLTVQKEIAERLVADVGSSDYSSLSVFIQSFCEVKILKVISKQCFLPVPQVDSAFIQIKPVFKFNEKYRNYSQFLKKIFSHRRKNIKNVFLNIFSEDTVNDILRRFNIDVNLRCENIKPLIFKQIYDNYYY